MVKNKAKVMKVKIANIPKDFKVIELSPKKTYYFQEFDEKLKLIKELCQETGKAYTMDMSLVDYDDPDIEQFNLDDYKFTSATPVSIKKIVEHEALKDSQTDEKGVSDEYKKSFHANLVESHEYDVATNTEVKNGKIKKAGILGKLKFRAGKGKVEDEIFTEEEEERFEEVKADAVAASIEPEEIHKTDEVIDIVGLSDSHEESQDKKIEKTTESVTLKESENSLPENQSNPSVIHSEIQINDHNVNEQKPVEFTEEKPVVDNIIETKKQNEITSSIVENHYKETYNVKDIVDTSSEKVKRLRPVIEVEDPLEQKILEYKADREEEKAILKNEELAVIEVTLEEYIAAEDSELAKKIRNYYEQNKPDYDTYIDKLIDQEAPVNQEQINKLEQQLNDDIEKILKADDEQYKITRSIKENQLHADKEAQLEEKRRQIKEGIQVLKTRAINELDENLAKEIDNLKNEEVSQIIASAKQLKIEKMRELSWKLIGFDKETYERINDFKKQWEAAELKKERLDIQQKELQTRNRELQIEDEKIRLEIIKAEKEKAKAEASIAEAKMMEDEVKLAQEKAKAKALDLEIKRNEAELRNIAAKEEENRINKERNELKNREILAREKESDHLNKLANDSLYKQFIPVAPVQEQPKVIEEPKKLTSEATIPVEPVVSKPANPVGKSVAVVALLALIGGGSYFLGDTHLLDHDKPATENVKSSKDNSKTKEYQSLINNKQFFDAYKMKPSKASDIKNKALEEKDYVDSVKIAKATKDWEYLYKVYMKNGNLKDMTSSYKSLSYEERLEISPDTRKRMAEKYISNDQLGNAKFVNDDLKDAKIKKEIADKESAEKEKKNNVVSVNFKTNGEEN